MVFFFFSLKKPSQKTPRIVRPWAGPGCHTVSSPRGDGWLVTFQVTEPGLTMQGLSPRQGQSTLPLPQCLKRAGAPVGISLTHGQRQRPQGSLGNGGRSICCNSWTQFSSPPRTAFSSLGLWTGPATSQKQAMCLAVSEGASLVPLGSNSNTLTGEEGRAEFISEIRAALWKLSIFIALTSSEA